MSLIRGSKCFTNILINSSQNHCEPEKWHQPFIEHTDRRIQTAVCVFKEEKEMIDTNIWFFVVCYLLLQNPGFPNTGVITSLFCPRMTPAFNIAVLNFLSMMSSGTHSAWSFTYFMFLNFFPWPLALVCLLLKQSWYESQPNNFSPPIFVSYSGIFKGETVTVSPLHFQKKLCCSYQ